MEASIKEALNTYIEWLNQKGQRGEFELDEDYTFDDLFRYTGTHSSKGTFWGRHHETFIQVDTRFGDNRLIIMSAGTADDGGAAQLFILLDDDNIVQITQQFDTLYSLVYFNSQYAEEGRTLGIVPFGWSPRKPSEEDPQA